MGVARAAPETCFFVFFDFFTFFNVDHSIPAIFIPFGMNCRFSQLFQQLALLDA
jgi:hypothetical protein